MEPENTPGGEKQKHPDPNLPILGPSSRSFFFFPGCKGTVTSSHQAVYMLKMGSLHCCNLQVGGDSLRFFFWLTHEELAFSYLEIYERLGGGFKHFLFSPLLGEMIQFD